MQSIMDISGKDEKGEGKKKTNKKNKNSKSNAEKTKRPGFLRIIEPPQGGQGEKEKAKNLW